jgi:hypothetical protein
MVIKLPEIRFDIMNKLIVISNLVGNNLIYVKTYRIQAILKISCANPASQMSYI